MYLSEVLSFLQKNVNKSHIFKLCLKRQYNIGYQINKLLINGLI